ncbi:MAG: hypothetical protein DPW18_19750 [Chloroflexi bacterium]|nr:hypothetical protein [Chloroflexota bacterium]MDL1945018.1 hypothetical protein [Chloroflexi bacterium CFX2]
MNSPNAKIALGILLGLLAGCSTANPPAASTLEPTDMPAPADTLSPGSNLPAYSEIVETYPAGVELCATEASLDGIADNGRWLLNGEIQIKDDQMQVKCYGTKITVNVEGGDVIIDGVIYSKGALLTVDKDLNWIEVSSWE